ncbi:MAG TPA: NAD(P)-binding domain-containing protein, partial [Thermodesulfobacteriota bacterium]|nr:NAD(P)-binding domain-containing protein [Thermodesulfobacteriota bacterium]
MSKSKSEIGVIGLGEMGQNLVLNLADHGFSVVVYNRTREKTRGFMDTFSGSFPIRPAYQLSELTQKLRKPRAVLLMVSAGQAVDALIEEILPFLEPGDLLIDGGNSLYRDTDRRTNRLKKKGLLYLGLGISGGGRGARYGPSLMPGGSPSAYERIRPYLEGIAAKVDGSPCVTYLGPASSGHYVKMVHNGIEYGLMQLIAEAYQLLKKGLGLSNDELSSIFRVWNENELQGYLIEITSRIFL